jgi:hypothetical protein
MEKITLEQESFFKNEITYLRNTYTEAIKETRTHERFSLLSSGIIWSWYAINVVKQSGQKDLLEFSIILWIPAVITFLFGMRSWGISIYMKKIRKYIIKIEKVYYLPDEYGWEQNTDNDHSRFEIYTVYLFWVLLQTATIGVPFIIQKFNF